MFLTKNAINKTQVPSLPLKYISSTKLLDMPPHILKNMMTFLFLIQTKSNNYRTVHRPYSFQAEFVTSVRHTFLIPYTRLNEDKLLSCQKKNENATFRSEFELYKLVTKVVISL